MRNILAKITLVLALAGISLGASANVSKYEKCDDPSARIARTVSFNGSSSRQIALPQKQESDKTFTVKKNYLQQGFNSGKSAFEKKPANGSGAVSGIRTAAATDITATRYSAKYYEETKDWYIVVQTNTNLTFIFDILTETIELGKVYTLAEMDPDYTFIKDNSAGKDYSCSAASFCKTENDGLERIECSMTSGQNVFNIVYQEIAVPTPTSTVNVAVSAADFSDLLSNYGLFEFLGYSDDEKYFVNYTPYASSLVGEHTIEDFDGDYTYVREFNDAGTYTQYAVLGFDGPVTVTDDGNGCYTCHARMIAENAVLYDVTFEYAPHMSGDTKRDLEIEYSTSEVSLSAQLTGRNNYIDVTLYNGLSQAKIRFYVDKSQVVGSRIPVGTYVVNDSKQTGTILASPGMSSSGSLQNSASYIGTIAGQYLDDIWFLEGGSATVTDDHGQLVCEINALNSYGNSVKIKFKYGEKTGGGWGEWKDYAPMGDATGYYYYSVLPDQPGIKPDISVKIRRDIEIPELAQIKLEGWASDVYVDGEGPDLLIDWDTESNQLRVRPQETGITDGGEKLIIADVGVFDESYLPSYPCYYDPELGRFMLNVLYGAESRISDGYGMLGEEYFQMDGYKDYTFDGWMNAFDENVSAGTANLTYALYEAGDDLEYGMLYALAQAGDVMTKGNVDPEKVAALLSKAEVSFYPSETFTLPAPGTYYVVAGSLDEDGEYSGNFDCEQYVFESSKNWKRIGTGTYTDDLVAAYYNGLDNLTYEVEVQENVNNPGLYRIKNVYGSAFLYNENDPRYYREDSYVYIDATNPNAVTHYKKLPTGLGINWGDGELSWEVRVAGTMVDNVITLPMYEQGSVQSVVVSDPSGSGYYANRNGAFKLVIKYEVPLEYEVSGTEVTVTPSDNVYEGEVEIPEKVTIDGADYAVTKVGAQAFAGQNAVTGVSLPSSITEIEASAFTLCIGIESITCTAAVPPTCGATAFYKINPAITVKVPAGSIDAYKSADGWKMFTNFEEIK